MEPKDDSRKIEILGNYGALLSMIEVGMGSLLHTFHLPFSGFFLSLNQGYLLCRVAILTQDNWISYSVSNIAAVLKSLSPSGNKLGPMLSLSMQGLLFNLGTIVFGINPLGLSLGMVLLSFWSFVQPLITYYVFFGEKLFNAAEFIYKKTLPYHGIEARYLGWIFLGVVLTKILLGIALALLAWKNQGKSGYQERWAKLSNPFPASTRHPALLALKDLTRPLFLTSLLCTGTFFYFSQHKMAEIIWLLMRPIAIGFIFFYFSRTLTLDRWLIYLHGGRFETFAKGCEIALVKLRKII